MAGRLREVKLLLVFLFRIALFAGLLGLGRFDAALVVAFLAGLFGLVAAALSAGAQGSREKREGAGNHREQFNALHRSYLLLSCKTIAGVWTTAGAPGAGLPKLSRDLLENWPILAGL